MKAHFGSITLALVCSSCSLQPPQQTVRVSASLAASSTPASHSLLQLSPLSSAATSTTTSLPLSASGFNCLALNVLGEDIPAQNPDPTHPWNGDYLKTLHNLLDPARTSDCSYPGIRSVPVVPKSGGDAVFSVSLPNSPAMRMLQVVGILDPDNTVCGDLQHPAGDTDLGSTSQTKVSYYEIGRVAPFLTNSSGSSSDVSIANEWDAATLTDAVSADHSKRILNCGDSSSTSTTTTTGNTGTSTTTAGITCSTSNSLQSSSSDLPTATTFAAGYGNGNYGIALHFTTGNAFVPNQADLTITVNTASSLPIAVAILPGDASTGLPQTNASALATGSITLPYGSTTNVAIPLSPTQALASTMEYWLVLMASGSFNIAGTYDSNSSNASTNMAVNTTSGWSLHTTSTPESGTFHLVGCN